MRLLIFDANVSKQLRAKYTFALAVLPVGLMFLSFIPLWLFSKGLSNLLGIQTDAPINGQPNGLLWIIILMSATAVLLITGYVLGFLLNALIMRLAFGWSWMQLREIFLFSRVPDYWLDKGKTASETRGFKKHDFILSFLFILSMLLLLAETNSLGNTIGGYKLFSAAALAGGIAGLGLAWYFNHSRRFVPDTRFSLVTYFIIVMAIFSLFSVTAANRINRQWGGNSIYFEMLTIASKGNTTGHSGTPRRSLFLLNSSYRTAVIPVSEAFWQSVAPGESVKLTLRDGFFGLPIVMRYDRLEQNVSKHAK